MSRDPEDVKLPIPDQAERDLAIQGYERHQIVEASAGTGKTTTLISRILEAVKTGDALLSQIAAMTFTEKAAAEMKVRLREALDDAIANEGRAEFRPALLKARASVESAEISTIHSFCAGLLREQPVAAGVDPDFGATDSSLAKGLLSEEFPAWLNRQAADPASAAARAIRAGAHPARILELALELLGERALLDGTALPTDALGEARQEIDALIELFEEALDSVAPPAREDKKTLQVISGLADLRAVRALDLPAAAAWTPSTKFDFRSGSRKAHDEEVLALLNACKDGFRELTGRLRDLPKEAILAELVVSLQGDLLAWVEEEKRRAGLLDFDDLLLRARDLLRSHEAMRTYFRDRYRTFVVDEFQDTDPVQAEIVLRLAAGEPQDGDAWKEAELTGSPLCLVGDPKQSIYRFRRADVETYRRARERYDEEARIPLRTNFRSDARILEYVNALLEPVMVEDPEAPWEIGYAPLEPNPNRPLSTVERPVVHLLPPPPGELAALEGPAPVDEEDDGQEREESPALAQQEARAVANYLRGLHGAFPCERWSDVAVIVHRNDAIDRLQEALSEAGIPAILEGGRSFYKREETAAVAAALRAIDDPGDGVAVVATLKSFLFGLSDVDLLEAGPFEEWDRVPPASSVGQALGLLRELHARRHRRPCHETLADLLARRLAFCSVAGGAVVNEVQGAANLERLLALARDLERERPTFREAVDRLALRAESDEGEPRAWAEDHDAVRLITIHKAKGLEFNVVVLADLGLKTRSRSPSLFHDRADGEFGVSLRFGDRAVKTPGATRLLGAYESRSLAEQKRFLYVALTRAKEMLVVSWFRPFTSGKKGITDQIGKTLLGPIAPFERPDAPLDRFVELLAADVRPPARPAEAETDGDEECRDVETAVEAARFLLERARDGAARDLRRAGEKPSEGFRLSRPEDLPPPERDDERQGRAVRVGIAVHEAMERLLSSDGPLPLGGAIEAASSALAPDERVEAERLARKLAVLPIVARALSARRRFVELPILFRDGEGDGAPLVEGKIDLLFEEPEGYVVVDWKTDRIGEPGIRTLREKLYAPQLEAYARGLGVLLGPAARVKETLLVFARDGEPG